ncbi:hypothetical protein C3492_32405 [Streptomyces sp. Ru62]|uniref:DUF6214 family protein n=1 Tax=Streptomyces sp. Ru62 TaxID=2080745 RepID=UPI000CDDF1AC|nr:DUF6214 family protein [Streptomyces sp. Ru62]POX59507.1 hypothetical protein C3492_32405 [Streptomyces sp. Ru62]
MWPAWQVREHDGVTSWFQVRLAFPDGARVDALAVVSAGRVSIEDVQAEPALSLADLTALAAWIEGPLSEACGVVAEADPECGADTAGAGDGATLGAYDATPDAECPRAGEPGPDVGHPVARRARPPWPRGTEGRRLVAREYRAAQDEGADPVLAVMNATGRGRRRALRLIAQARDAGLLAPRHARR